MKSVWQEQVIMLYKFNLTFKIKGEVLCFRKSVWASCASVACRILLDYAKRENVEIEIIFSVIREPVT